MNGQIVAPCAKKLKAIVFSTVPSISSDGCRPYVEISNNVDDIILHSTRDGDPLPRYYSSHSDSSMLIEFNESEEPILTGDVQFVFKNRGVISDSVICRVALNTAFISASNTLTLNKLTVSPDKIKKDSRITGGFMLHFVFEDYCKHCIKPSEMQLEDFCTECRELLKDEILYWRSIKLVASGRSEVGSLEDGIRLHYQTEQEDDTDKKTILGLKLQFQSESYKIKTSKYRNMTQNGTTNMLEATSAESNSEVTNIEGAIEETKSIDVFNGFDLQSALEEPSNNEDNLDGEEDSSDEEQAEEEQQQHQEKKTEPSNLEEGL